jgi:hypothetical protein
VLRLVPSFLLRLWWRFVELDLVSLQLLIALANFGCLWELKDDLSPAACIRRAQRLHRLVEMTCETRIVWVHNVVIHIVEVGWG